MKLNKTLLDIARNKRNADIKRLFKSEWAEKDHRIVSMAIMSHFNNRVMETLHGNHPAKAYRPLKEYEQIMGLPYTSGSSYAGLWVTNTEVYCVLYPGYKYEGFALSESGVVYAILWDKDENEILMPL